MRFYGQVSEEGVLKITNRKQFDVDIKDFSGKYVVIDITKKKSIRSLSQNAYYHSAVVPLVRQGLKDLGHKLTLEDTHLFLRGKFLKEELVSEDGEVIGERIKSTTELTKSAFADYISEIQQFSAEILGVNIPNPNEQLHILNN